MAYSKETAEYKRRSIEARRPNIDPADVPFDDLALFPSRTKIFKGEGIDTLADLLRCSRNMLLCMHGVGNGTVDSIEEILDAYGYELADDEEALHNEEAYRRPRKYEEGNLLYYKGDIRVRVRGLRYNKRRWEYLIIQNPIVYSPSVDEWDGYSCWAPEVKLSTKIKKDIFS